MPEGPVMLKDGGFLVVEMAPGRGCVTRLKPDGSIDKVLATTGRPNGLALDSSGSIWIAESERRSLTVLRPDGRIEDFAKSFEGEAFLFPNDLAFGPDGYLYMTDSGFRIQELATEHGQRPDWSTMTIDGRVIRIDTKTGAVECVDRGIRFPNGVAIGTDGMLYVSATVTGMVYRYSLNGDRVGEREPFGNVVKDPDNPVLRGPDGMKFAENGHLYVTVFRQSDITVLDGEGRVTGRIPTEGELPTNLVFGPHGSETIYVTENQNGAIEMFDVGIDGAQLFY